MLIWERYGEVGGEGDTWGCEWDEIDRLALIKNTAPDEYTIIVGTLKDAEYISKAQTLPDAKARAVRYMLLILNDADVERLKYKI
jgi:hypothetical protein